MPKNKNKKYYILIAEDGNINFLLLKTIIQKEAPFECEIIRAENGQIAIDICKTNHNIDLVLMDIEMPVMNGFNATIRIKELHPDLPIIAQTAYTSKENRDKALQAGCSDFISKPIRKERIAKVLSKYLCEHPNLLIKAS